LIRITNRISVAQKSTDHFSGQFITTGLFQTGADFAMSLQEELGHIKNHVKYPASKQQVIEACNNMSDVPSQDKDFVSRSLPDQTYRGPEDVVSALIKRA
jgi:hypothetical protein